MQLKNPKFWVFIVCACLAVVLRIYSLSKFYLLDGDSAVFGLMAKHIHGLSEIPVYMWFNHYAGALVSYIGAVFFALLGVSSWNYCLSGVLLSFCWVLATMGIGGKILDLPGFICAAGIAVIPPALLLFYSLYPGGVQAETLLSCVCILYILLDYVRLEGKAGFLVYFILGLFCGAGLWLSPGVFPALLTVLTVFILEDRKIFSSKRIVVFLTGLSAGLLPVIVYNIYNSGATFLHFGGRLLNLSRASLSGGDFRALLAHGFWQRLMTVPFFLAQIPTLLVRLLGMFNAVLFLIGGAVVLTSGFRSFVRDRKINVWFICLIYVVWCVLFYCVAVGLNAPRYLLGLVVIFPFVAGKLLSIVSAGSKVLFYPALAVILAVNALGIAESWGKSGQPRHAELASWLERNKFYYGYSDYLTAYPVTFHSNERVIISPALFNASFYERSPEYTRRVGNSGNAVYIVDMLKYPSLSAQIESGFSRLGVKYSKQIYDRFSVYHSVSRRLEPRELNITDPRVDPGGK